MKAISFDQLQETVYHEKLPNGLNVYLLPKPGFQKTYATFSTHYGSIDNHFQVEGQNAAQVPDGIAHFLEHKMFEEPEGDIFAKFASLGASANAFTSFDRTVYLFSATNQIEQSLTTLIDFVQNPYFTDQNVEKEKGIIGQEINMYGDNPDWRVYFGLIEALYAKHPVRIDIAGTVASISEITKETLYLCYHAFYHPTNMSLFIVGGFEPELIMELVRANQAAKTFPPQGEIQRFFEEEPQPVKQKEKRIELPVSLPKCLFGFKDLVGQESGEQLLRKELTTKLALDALLSGSSNLYQSMYDDGIISDSFGHEFNCGVNYSFSIIGGDTKDPEALMARVSEELKRATEHGIDAAAFERSKRKKIGAFLRMMNSPESLAHEFTKYEFKGTHLFDVLQVYESITHEEANRRIAEHVDFDRMAVCIVHSPEGEPAAL
ncbi:EF-P 5-aminopentanol modification-associated protein YfmH [Paenibacillus koleovorans]|uniref:EF-P 5-aminopentanol modification-associated protein YfmH n=1 Tax=Paenibacillus koleovorans TaxID=121608 RepID=UPI000FD844E8|nr:pitrilysin family protein [Paenibacillus koleovorans]